MTTTSLQTWTGSSEGHQVTAWNLGERHVPARRSSARHKWPHARLRGHSVFEPLRDASYAPKSDADPLKDDYIMLKLHRAEDKLDSEVRQLGRKNGVDDEFSGRVARLLSDIAHGGTKEPRVTFDQGEGEFHIQWFARSRHIEISIPQSDEVYVSVSGFGNMSFTGFFAAFPTVAVRRVVETLQSN